MTDNCYLARTFISQEEYFANQKELDNEAFEILKEYKRDVWNDTLNRDEA